jgi:hypothetical protein
VPASARRPDRRPRGGGAPAEGEGSRVDLRPGVPRAGGEAGRHRGEGLAGDRPAGHAHRHRHRSRREGRLQPPLPRCRRPRAVRPHERHPPPPTRRTR